MATPNLNLPQWELTDPILMEEFNNAFQIIDQFSVAIKQEITACNQIVLLWEGSLNPNSSITLSHTVLDFMQLWICTDDGVTLTGVVSPSEDNITNFTAIATGAFAGASATIYGFSATISENGNTLNNAFCYSQEIGTNTNTPITAKAIYGIGKRDTAAVDPVLIHNSSPITHTNMVVDGNNSAVADTSSSLQEHIASPQAHQNLIIDGNES